MLYDISSHKLSLNIDHNDDIFVGSQNNNIDANNWRMHLPVWIDAASSKHFCHSVSSCNKLCAMQAYLNVDITMLLTVRNSSKLFALGIKYNNILK